MSGRPQEVEAILARFDEGFPSNTSEDEMVSELWRGVGCLKAYIESVERERDGLGSWVDSLRDLPEGTSLRDYRADVEKWGEE